MDDAEKGGNREGMFMEITDNKMTMMHHHGCKFPRKVFSLTMKVPLEHYNQWFQLSRHSLFSEHLREA